MEILKIVIILASVIMLFVIYKKMRSTQQLSRFNEKNLTNKRKIMKKERDQLNEPKKVESISSQSSETKKKVKTLTNKSTSYFGDVKRVKSNPPTPHLPLG